MKTAALQGIFHTTLGDNIKVNFEMFFLFVPIFIPDAQTQVMVNDSIKDSFTLSFDSWSTDRKSAGTQLEYQVDICSAQIINSPKNLIEVHQTTARIGVPNKSNIVAVFDHLDVRKYHVDINGVRFPRDGVNVDCGLNDYVDQYRALKIFYKEYVGEELPNPFNTYPDMKNKYPFQLIGLRFQVDHISSKKMKLFEEYRGVINKPRLFIMLIRHGEIKMLSDGNKTTDVSVI